MDSSSSGVNNIDYDAATIPNLSETAVQGFARDAYHLYLADSNFSTKVEALKKQTIQGIEAAINTSPFTSLPAGNWKMNDICVHRGLVLGAVSDRNSDSRLLVRWNKSDLSYNSDVDISAYFEFGASVCVGHTGNLFLVAFKATSNINANRVLELNHDGQFVAYHPINTEILEMQGIAWDGTNYFISTSLADLVYELDSSFNVVNTYTNNAAMTEIEGVEHFEGTYYSHDLNSTPYSFLTRSWTAEVDTFPTGWTRIVPITGATPSASLGSTALLITEVNLPSEIWAEAQNGGGDIRACTGSDGTGQIPLLILDFDTVNQTAKILVEPSYDVGSETVYIAYGNNSAVESPPNGSHGRDAILNNRSLSLYAGIYDLKGDATSKQESSNSGFFVPNKGTDAPTGLPSVNFGSTSQTSWMQNTIANQQEYTLVCWYKAYAVDASGNDLIALQESNPSSNSSFVIDDQSPNDIGSFVTGSSWLRSGVTRSVGNWQRIVVAVSNANLTRKIWIDGVLRANDSLSAPESATRTVARIGQRIDNNVNYQTAADMSGIEIINEVVNDGFAATDYSNQKSTASFWTTGTPSALGGEDNTIDIAFNLTQPSFSGVVTVTIPPANNSTVALNGLSPNFSASMAIATPGNNTINAAFTGLQPTFNAGMTVTVPPANDLTVTMNGLQPNFSGNVTVNVPGNTVDIAFTGLQPSFSADMVLTIPDVNVTVALNGLQPTFSATLTNGKIVLVVTPETNITVGLQSRDILVNSQSRNINL